MVTNFNSYTLKAGTVNNQFQRLSTMATFIGVDPALASGGDADQNMNNGQSRSAPLSGFYTAVENDYVDVGHVFGRSRDALLDRPTFLGLYVADGSGIPTGALLASVEVTMTANDSDPSQLETESFTRFNLTEGVKYNAGLIGLTGSETFVNLTTALPGNSSIDFDPNIVLNFVDPWVSDDLNTVGGMLIGFEVKNDGGSSPTLTTPYIDLINLDTDVVSVDLRDNMSGESTILVEWNPAIPKGLSETNGLVTGTVTTPTGTAIATVTGFNQFGSVTDSFQWTTLTTGDPTSGINVPINEA